MAGHGRGQAQPAQTVVSGAGAVVESEALAEDGGADARAASPGAAAAPLRPRMLRAAGWLLGSNLSSQLLRLGSNLVLTRLLVPEAFGLAVAVNTLYFALVMFSDLGVWQSVVRSKRGEEARFLGTAWTLQLARGALVATLVLGLAWALHIGVGNGFIAAGTVYADPRLPEMVAFLALCALVQGAESMKLATAQRELRAAALARLELLGQLVAIAVTLALASQTRSVWSLLIGSLAGSLARTALSHALLPGPSARPCWDRAAVREILGLGKWIFASSLIGFLAANAEKLILGGLLSPESFGVFSIAATLLAAVAGLYGAMNGHVVFSSLSLAQREHRAELGRLYARSQQLADLVLGLLAGTLVTAGQSVVWLLYDPRYHEAGWMLQWLAVGLIAMRHQVVEQLMFAQGRAARVSTNNLLRGLALAALIPAGHAAWGEQGAILAVVASQFAGWPLSLMYKRDQRLLAWATEGWWVPALLGGLGLGTLIEAGFALVLPN